jgi:MFS family permease
MMILGAGLGLFTPANNRATMATTPRDKLGVMGGLLNMMRSLGLIFGVDISGMLFIVVANSHSAGAKLPHNAGEALAFLSKPAFMDGFHGVMVSLAAVALLAAVLSWFRRDKETKTPTPVSSNTVELM